MELTNELKGKFIEICTILENAVIKYDLSPTEMRLFAVHWLEIGILTDRELNVDEYLDRAAKRCLADNPNWAEKDDY